jgi:hypothetical protein
MQNHPRLSETLEQYLAVRALRLAGHTARNEAFVCEST